MPGEPVSSGPEPDHGRRQIRGAGRSLPMSIHRFRHIQNTVLNLNNPRNFALYAMPWRGAIVRNCLLMETGMDGGFAFTGLRSGTYTVDQRLSGGCLLETVMVEVGDVGQADFTGHSIRTSAVEGQVMIEGEGLPGVTVALTGGPADESFTTTASGRLHGQHRRLRSARLRVRIHVAGRERGPRRDRHGVLHGHTAAHVRQAGRVSVGAWASGA